MEYNNNPIGNQQNNQMNSQTNNQPPGQIPPQPTEIPVLPNAPAEQMGEHEEYEEYDEDPVQEVLDVWDEDEFAPRGEDFLPVSIAISTTDESPDAVTLLIEAVDANFSVRMHKEELKQIAQKLVEACKEL